jgi:hypothetical protein
MPIRLHGSRAAGPIPITGQHWYYVGAALGVAIVSTVAVSRSEDYLAANEGANPLVVLNEASSPRSWPASSWPR